MSAIYLLENSAKKCVPCVRWIDLIHNHFKKNDIQHIYTSNIDLIIDKINYDDIFICRLNETCCEFFEPYYYEIANKINKAHLYPNPKSLELYNNKEKQFHYFNSNGIPTPLTGYAENIDELISFQKLHNLEFPLVIKKKTGSSGYHVRLMHPEDEFKFSCIVQEFIPDLNFDFRILLLNKKIYGYKRLTKSGDFRASGSGIREKIHSIPEEILSIVKKIQLDFNPLTMCFDFIYDKKRECYLLLEMSYTFDSRIIDLDLISIGYDMDFNYFEVVDFNYMNLFSEWVHELKKLHN